MRLEVGIAGSAPASANAVFLLDYIPIKGGGSRQGIFGDVRVLAHGSQDPRYRLRKGEAFLLGLAH